MPGGPTMAGMEEPITPYAALFDSLSGVYDQTGVPFFSVNLTFTFAGSKTCPAGAAGTVNVQGMGLSTVA